MSGSGSVQVKTYIIAAFHGVSVMLVQRLGIIFVIFVAFALSFGSFVNHAKSKRVGHYQNNLLQVRN